MKKLTLVSHNPDVVPQKSKAALTSIDGGKSQEAPVGRFLLDGETTIVRSEFKGPSGQSVRLVETTGFLMVQKLVEFGLGESEIEWEVKDLAPASMENQAKMMVIFAKLVNEACIEELGATA